MCSESRFVPQLASATSAAQSPPCATRRRASASASQGRRGASVPTACRASGASLSADRVTVTATASTATLRPESVRAAGTSPPDTTVRGAAERLLGFMRGVQFQSIGGYSQRMSVSLNSLQVSGRLPWRPRAGFRWPLSRLHVSRWSAQWTAVFRQLLPAG